LTCVRGCLPFDREAALVSRGEKDAARGLLRVLTNSRREAAVACLPGKLPRIALEGAYTSSSIERGNGQAARHREKESGKMDRLRLLSFSLILLCPAVLQAEAPHVQFDLPYAVACRDVTPPDFAIANPGQKLVEVKLEISSLLTAGSERDLTQYFIRVDSPERTLAVVDYLPKTSHESRMAGNVNVQKGKENSTTLGINFSGKYEVISAVGPSAGVSGKNTSCVKYDLLPPLETVAASGTLLRGSAVFFKIKASPRQLLEGTREYGLVLRVPTNWRADYLRVRCEAEGIQRSVVSTFDEEVNCGQKEFLVSLYQAGDEQARRTAENFARQRAMPVQSPKSKVQGSAAKSAANWTLNVAPWEMLKR
jgi:hypothetical protein